MSLYEKVLTSNHYSSKKHKSTNRPIHLDFLNDNNMRHLKKHKKKFNVPFQPGYFTTHSKACPSFPRCSTLHSTFLSLISRIRIQIRIARKMIRSSFCPLIVTRERKISRWHLKPLVSQRFQSTPFFYFDFETAQMLHFQNTFQK